MSQAIIVSITKNVGDLHRRLQVIPYVRPILSFDLLAFLLDVVVYAARRFIAWLLAVCVFA